MWRRSGYYPGQELVVQIRGVKTFKSFFVAAHLKGQQFDMFDSQSGERVGSFDRESVMENENAWLSCKGKRGLFKAATSDSRKKNTAFNTLNLRWNAPVEGVGDITFRTTVTPKDEVSIDRQLRHF